MLRFYDPPPSVARRVDAFCLDVLRGLWRGLGGPLHGSTPFKRPEVGHSPTSSGGWVSDTPKKRGLPGCRDLPASQGSSRAKGQGPFRTFRASDFAAQEEIEGFPQELQAPPCEPRKPSRAGGRQRSLTHLPSKSAVGLLTSSPTYHHDASRDSLEYLARSARGGRPRPPLPLCCWSPLCQLEIQSHRASAKNAGCGFALRSEQQTWGQGNQEPPLARGIWGIRTLNPN